MSEQPPSHSAGVVHAAGAVHEVRWSEICPWLILVKALRVALLIRVLVIAAIGVVLTQAGWTVISEQFTPELPLPTPLREELPTIKVDQQLGEVLGTTRPASWQSGTLLSGWYWLTQPFLALSNRELSWQTSLGTFSYGLWAILVWSLLGGAICRIASIYLTRSEIIGPLRAVREALTVWLDTLGSPLIVLLAAVALSVPLLLLGFLLRLSLFAVVSAALWCFVFAWGFMLAVILVGLLLGWPLMWACLSVERSDAFDGVSRCYAYVYQRPLQFICIVILTAALGICGDFVVTYFAAITVSLSEWTLSWSTGADHALQLFALDSEASPTPIATRLIHKWKWALETVVLAFPIASLWPMSVGIYLLLRRQVDATELDEITLADGSIQSGLPEEDSETANKLQPEDSDPQGE